MQRRSLLKAAALLAASSSAAWPEQVGQSEVHTSPFPVHDRLDQGPFGIEQDEGWQTILFTTPSEKPLRNPGLGLVGYTWEENGPALAVRAGRETLEHAIEKMATLPFV